jgi:phosphopantothenoylcysteine decarboxylase/phosphopantothenate--cysteine ligase
MKNKNILVGITGSIAAYKAIFLISKLKKEGFNIRCVLTQNATQFVTPLTIQTLSQNPVFSDQFATNSQYIDHIDLTKWADLILIAPATANFIAKAALGIADDMLTSLYLAANYNTPIVIAPAMNREMWNNPITQKNICVLKNLNVTILDPQDGLQACGDVGIGRMMEPEHIFEHIINLNTHALHLKNKKILITAGPTIEQIDPVRYISNHSSGKMGYALANAALAQGAEVTLITGPTNLNKPQCKILDVTTADEMYNAVLSQIEKTDIFISAAAVSDYKPKQQFSKKIKKDQDSLSIEFLKTKDIIKEIAQKYSDKLIIGFAAETCDLEENAIKKLKTKKLDMIIANSVSAINSEQNAVIIIDNKLHKEYLPLSSKENIAKQIINYIVNFLKA